MWFQYYNINFCWCRTLMFSATSASVSIRREADMSAAILVFRDIVLLPVSMRTGGITEVRAVAWTHMCWTLKMVWSKPSEVRYTFKTRELGQILNLLMEEKRENLKHVGETWTKRLTGHMVGKKKSPLKFSFIFVKIKGLFSLADEADWHLAVPSICHCLKRS